jgi:hypothetical protein
LAAGGPYEKRAFNVAVQRPAQAGEAVATAAWASSGDSQTELSGRFDNFRDVIN